MGGYPIRHIPRRDAMPAVATCFIVIAISLLDAGASVPLTATGTLRWKKHAHYMGESMSYIRRAECTVLPHSLTSPTSKILGGLAGCARRRALARRTTRVSIQAGHHPLMRMNRPSWAVWMSGPYLISCCARPCVPAPRSRCACKCRAQGLAGARDIRYVGEGADGAIACVLTFEGELDDAQRTRLADIAERTPVTLTLKRGLAITTTLG